MSDVESLSHSGISVPDVREGERFYKTILGGRHSKRDSLNVDDVLRGKGVPHPNVVIGEFLFVTFPHDDEVPEQTEVRGVDGSRHSFSVPRTRFQEVLDRLRDNEVPFEGPVVHPESGPLGESVYFADPGGNFFEVCWRRDEGHHYNAVMRGQD